MKIKEIIKIIENGAKVDELNCDGIKSGSIENEIEKIGVSMFATVDVLRRAIADGVNFLIVHEPTYYEHMEIFFDSPVSNAKRELIKESGITIYRWHDHAHYRENDYVTESECELFGLCGKVTKTEFCASYLMDSDEYVTGLEIAKRIEDKAGVKHVRIIGSRDRKCKKIALCFGTPGGVFELLRRPDVDMVITGEICEWAWGEYARDADALGITKSLIVAGHIGSERAAMVRLANELIRYYPSVKYYECGEVYTYTDDTTE